jgi:hypothetical protein
MSRATGASERGGRLVRDVDVISRLRALQPNRRLTWSEAHSMAERQATLLLELLHVTEPPVPQFVISSLPGILVDRRTDWPISGTAVRSRSHWRIVLKADEPRQRQRFSLAHEFKHVLDDPVAAQAYAGRRPERVERLCNYFAACLLMPRAWIKHDFCGGLQNIHDLARRYYVSEEAMSTRLAELGLTTTPLALPTSTLSRHTGAA